MNLKSIICATSLLLAACMGSNKNVSRNDTPVQQTISAMSIYDFKIPSLLGDTIDFQKYRGKKMVIVNTASECGYTPQYADLQKLQETYADKVAVLGFPCNDFGGQEPGTEEQIQTFCTKNFGVTFQLFEKVNVKGKDKHPLYQWLTDKSKNGWNTEEPGWNFCKYLINEKGELVHFFGSAVKPTDEAFVAIIEK